MSKLAIQLLQNPTISTDDGVLVLRDDKSWALLTYLLIHHDQPQRREHLAVLLWPEKSSKASRANLRKVLFHLRRTLANVADDLLVTTAQTVMARKGEVVSADIWQLQEGLAIKTISAATLPVLHQVAATYQSELLPNLVIDHSDAFNSWLDQQRDQLQQGIERLLTALSKYHRELDQFDEAIQFAERLLHIAPYDEEAVRQLMQLFAATGRRANAIQLYRQFSQRLASHVHLQPEEATRQLARHIEQTNVAASPPRRDKLPAATTELISRASECERISKMLNDPACRLLTLLGMGGVGKTHLALTVAHNERAAGWEGIYFVTLDADVVVSAESDLAEQLAHGLHLSSHATAAYQRLLLFLNGMKRVLLFIDNFEQAVKAATLLSKLLTDVAHLTICVTSRLPLRVRAEHLFRVETLALPVDGSVAALRQSGAGLLFLTRVRQIRPNYMLTSAECQAIYTICHLTSGLPIALELAAIRLRQSEAQTVVKQLQTSIISLSTDLRDYPKRHQTMMAVFDSTWRLLDTQEQRTFLRLTVFQSGFTLEAGAAVARAAKHVITRLHTKLLLQRQNQRYDIHALLRQIGAARLQETTDQLHDARAAHADYYATYLQQQGARLDDAEMVEILEQMADEYANCMRAWRWLIEQADWARVERCCEGLALFFERTMRLREGEALLTLGIQQEMNTRLSCLLLTQQARLQMLRRHYQKAIATAQQALLIAERLEDDALIARNLLCWAVAQYQQGNSADATRHLQRAEPLCQANPLLLALCKQYQAGIAYHRGAYTQAEKHYDAAYQFYLSHAPRFPKQRAVVVNNLGNISLLQGAIAQARERYTTALQLRASSVPQSQFGGIVTRANLGLVALAQLQFDEAAEHFTIALTAHQRSGNRVGEARVTGYISELYFEMGDFKHALRDAERDLEMQEAQGQIAKRSHRLAHLALILLTLGDPEKALLFAYQAAQSAKSLSEYNELAFVQTVLGKIALACGDDVTAFDHFQQAVALRSQLGQTARTAEPLAGLALLALQQNEVVKAHEYVAPIMHQAMQPEGLDGVVDRFAIYSVCERALLAAEDERVDMLRRIYKHDLHKAHDSLKDETHSAVFWAVFGRNCTQMTRL